MFKSKLLNYWFGTCVSSSNNWTPSSLGRWTPCRKALLPGPKNSSAHCWRNSLRCGMRSEMTEIGFRWWCFQMVFRWWKRCILTTFFSTLGDPNVTHPLFLAMVEPLKPPSSGKVASIILGFRARCAWRFAPQFAKARGPRRVATWADAICTIPQSSPLHHLNRWLMFRFFEKSFNGLVLLGKFWTGSPWVLTIKLFFWKSTVFPVVFDHQTGWGFWFQYCPIQVREGCSFWVKSRVFFTVRKTQDVARCCWGPMKFIKTSRSTYRKTYASLLAMYGS